MEEIKKRKWKAAHYSFTVIIMALLVQACGTVPLTGRKQLQLISDQEVIALSSQQYQEFVRQAPIENGTRDAETVKRVGRRIATAVETFLKSNGYESELEKYNWEFNLVKDENVNAFAMPGGKVAVFSGLLPVAQDEGGLAVVIGHEIAHAVAKHANERISQQIALQYGGAIAGGLLGGASEGVQQIASTVFGLGSQFGILLPYARRQELESDELGLIFMALAGYDPRTAIPFWQRMAQQSQGQAPPEFMSTHPSDDSRISRLLQLMPTALKYYNGNGIENTDCTNPIECKTKIPVERTTAQTSEKWTF